MIKYAFYISNSQSGGEGQGNTQTDVEIDRQKKYYKTDRHTYKNRDHASNSIGV